jgi:hypothetical protein
MFNVFGTCNSLLSLGGSPRFRKAGPLNFSLNSADPLPQSISTHGNICSSDIYKKETHINCEILHEVEVKISY